MRASACVIHIDRETRSTWWARSMSIIHNDPCEKVEKAHDERGKRIFSKSINTKTAYELVNWAKSDVQLSRHLRAIKSNASVVIEIRITSAKRNRDAIIEWPFEICDAKWKCWWNRLLVPTLLFFLSLSWHISCSLLLFEVLLCCTVLSSLSPFICCCVFSSRFFFI